MNSDQGSMWADEIDMLVQFQTDYPNIRNIAWRMAVVELMFKSYTSDMN